MPAHQQGFDCFPVFTGAQLIVSPAMLDVESRIEIGMRVETARGTAKRLLVRSVGSIWIMAHAALLGGVGTLDTSCGYTSFGR